MDKLLLDCSAADHGDRDLLLDLMTDLGLIFGCHLGGIDIWLSTGELCL